jgi:hypothetical protein
MPSIISAGTTTGTALSLTSDTSGELQIQTNNGATTAMTLTTAGNVGIGTSSPTAYGAGYTTVDVKGTTQGSLVLGHGSTNDFIAYGAASESGLTVLTATPLILGTNSAERMRITSAGDVGIGTSSPYSGSGVKTLHLTGSDYSLFEQSVTTATAGYQNWRQIVRGSVGGHVYQLQLMNDANSAEQTVYEVSRTANSVAYQRWYGGTSEAMRIDSSGRVLMGQSSTNGSGQLLQIDQTSITKTFTGTGNTTINTVPFNTGQGGGLCIIRGADGSSGNAYVRIYAVAIQVNGGGGGVAASTISSTAVGGGASAAFSFAATSGFITVTSSSTNGGNFYVSFFGL